MIARHVLSQGGLPQQSWMLYLHVDLLSTSSISRQSLHNAETVSSQTAKKKVQLAEDAWNTW